LAGSSKKVMSAATKGCAEGSTKGKNGKCSQSEPKKEVKANVSTTVAAPNSVRSGSMEAPNSRAPASIMESNTH
jgi:hypothetical protein